MYAAQCAKCQKWRSIATKEEYEELRSTFTDDPFTCDRTPDLTCDDPTDLECDASRTWVIDKPNLPLTPAGFKRELILRADYSKLDAHYLTPTGKKVRCQGELVAFMEKHPEYQHLKLDDFNFTVPKVLEDTVPLEVRKKRAEKSAAKKEESDGKKKMSINS